MLLLKQSCISWDGWLYITCITFGSYCLLWSLNLNCIVTIGTIDIDICYFQNIQSLDYILELCSIERGGALQRLIFQVVFRILSTSSIAMSKPTLENKKDEAPHNSHILMKKLLRASVNTCYLKYKMHIQLRSSLKGFFL